MWPVTEFVKIPSEMILQIRERPSAETISCKKGFTKNAGDRLLPTFSVCRRLKAVVSKDEISVVSITEKVFELSEYCLKIPICMTN